MIRVSTSKRGTLYPLPKGAKPVYPEKINHAQAFMQSDILGQITVRENAGISVIVPLGLPRMLDRGEFGFPGQCYSIHLACSKPPSVMAFPRFMCTRHTSANSR